MPVRKYVHQGVRLKGKTKVAKIQLLTESGGLDPEAILTVGAKKYDQHLVGFVFEAEFSEDFTSASLHKSSHTSDGKWKDPPDIAEWVAVQNSVLAVCKVSSKKNDHIEDLSNRLYKERVAYQQALARGDLPTAQSVKDFIMLILDRKIEYKE